LALSKIWPYGLGINEITMYKKQQIEILKLLVMWTNNFEKN
jgi:hypothetical protein